MRVLGGIVGVLVGFVVGILLVEVIFPNNQSWPDAVPFGLAVFGWLVGTTLGRRVHLHGPASRLSRSN